MTRRKAHAVASEIVGRYISSHCSFWLCESITINCMLIAAILYYVDNSIIHGLLPRPHGKKSAAMLCKNQHSHHLKKSLIGLLHLPIFCYKIKYSKDLDRYQLSVIDSLLVEYVWLQLNRVSCYTVCWPKLAGQQSTKKSSTRNIYRSVQEGTVLLEELLFFTFPVILIIALHICNLFY